MIRLLQSTFVEDLSCHQGQCLILKQWVLVLVWICQKIWKWGNKNWILWFCFHGLCTLGSVGTTWMQTNSHSLVLKHVSVSGTLTFLISIHLTNFSFSRKPFLSSYLKSWYSAASVTWLAKQNSYISYISYIPPLSWVGFPNKLFPYLPNKLMLLDYLFAHGLLDLFCICKI